MNRRSAPRNYRRSAWTLIELLVVITLSSILMGIAITASLTVARTDRMMRSETETMATVHRMAESFRRDAHRAIRVTVDERGGSATFHLPDSANIVYHRDKDQWLRVEQEGLHEKSITTFFRLGHQVHLAFVRSEAVQQTILSAIFNRHPAKLRKPDLGDGPTILRIDAVVGRDFSWIPQP
ncbi:MAG: type II secretion system protein [Pirellulales bacterium]|nr:type II secretion system protein [Pirellulales bacterium]